MTQRLRGRAGQAQRDRRLRAHGVNCARCGCLGSWKRREATPTLPLLMPDHIVPLAKGGADEDGNIRVICEPCHDDVTREQFGQRRRVEVDDGGWPIG